MKTMSNWAADLDYDKILLEVHRFLKVIFLSYFIQLNETT